MLFSESLDERVERILEQSRVPGAAIGVVHRGRSFVRAFGTRGAESADAVTATTAFDIGSCSKSYVATAVAMLVGEGKLDFDAPVHGWLPELALDTPALTAQVTARDLLCNRIGLKRQIPVDAFANPELPAVEIIRRIGKLDRVYPFRAGYVYFNPGFIAARLLVERVAGMTYGDFLHRRLFLPLGMQHSASGSARVTQLADRATGHVEWQGRMREIHEDLFDPWQGAAGVHSCADDAARWLEFQLLQGPAVVQTHRPHTQIPRAECKLIHAPPEAERVDYCLGWWTTTLHGRRLVQHSGEMFGWRAHTALLPDEGIGVCAMLSSGAPRHQVIAYTVLEQLLTGRSRDWCEVADRIAAEFNAATTTSLERAFAVQSETTLPREQYVGRYRHPACGLVEIAESEDGLWMRFADGRIWEQQLRPLGGHVFEARPANPIVADYFPVPLRMRFDVRDGEVLSITDTQARYLRESP